MSKTEKNTPKKRKTRMTGTETHKPCCDCGVLKDRFKDFKPRWAGCATHRNEKGRRYHQKGCADCDAKVNGNIRQPRCIECDRNRPKKRKKKNADPTPTKVEAAQPEPQPVAQPEPEPVVEQTPEPQPEPEPVATVEGQDEPSSESEDVTPEPTPAPKARPQIATMADLSALFGGDEDE